MAMDCVWQTVIPDSLLVEIFGHLDANALGRAAQVCVQWRRVALDDFLWRNIARRNWDIMGKLSPGCMSWREEVKRLIYHVPSMESEVYEVHQDEVLDVAISHRGQYFCTTSKDVQAKLWKLDYPSFVLCDVDLESLLNWELTQYSSFNESDTLVFVCGVTKPDNFVQTGSGAVFTVPAMQLVCVIELDPPTLFGAWLTDRTFVGGSLADPQDNIKIESYEITDNDLATHTNDTDNYEGEDRESWLASLYKASTPVFTFRGNRYHQMNLLVASVPSSHTDRKNYTTNSLATTLGDRSNNSVLNSDIHSSQGGSQYEFCDSNNTGVRVEESVLKNKFNNSSIDAADSRHTRVNCTNDSVTAMDISYSDDVSISRPSISAGRGLDGESGSSIGDIGCGNSSVSNSSKSNCDKCMACDIHKESSVECRNNREWQDSCSPVNNATTGNCEGRAGHMTFGSHMITDSESCDLQTSYRTYVVFVTGDHDAIAVHELKADRGHPEGSTSPVEKIDHYFHLKDCYITGLSLSSDHRFLLFNYRGYDPKESINYEPSVPLYEKIFSQHLHVGTLDLITMSRVPECEYSGHIAFSSYPAWYICLDASPSYVGSGSEDGKGYVWDGHHGVLLSTLQHREGVVNGIAFCPNDEETCITVCDDRLVKIWRSRNRLKQVAV